MNSEDLTAAVKQITDALDRECANAMLTAHNDDNAWVEVRIHLAKDTWESQDRMIESILAIREQFLGKVSIDYHFV